MQAETPHGKFPSRKSLKKFYSVKHLPMQVTDNMEDVPISKLYPPPQLHCGILGPLNDTMKKLEQLFPVEMDQFKKNRHIKGSGPGGDYNGPTLKSHVSRHICLLIYALSLEQTLIDKVGQGHVGSFICY